MVHPMLKLCPNLDNEDGLETVLEVPIPEEMFDKLGSNASVGWRNLRNVMRAQRATDKTPSLPLSSNNHVFFLLKIVGSALIPFKYPSNDALTLPVTNSSIEVSTAKYIVQQYVAATGGHAAINSIKSMIAVGKVKMTTSDMVQPQPQPQQRQGDGEIFNTKQSSEVGGFVLWQKSPDLWYLELVISGCNISAGSDGKLAWSHSSNSNVHKGPPRPLRMFFQGLDPRSTASLFLNAVCIGETKVGEEECFILKLETGPEMLNAQNTPNTNVVHHTIWGSFSQRTGLLIKFCDTKLVRLNNAAKEDSSVFWETTMESTLEDYKYIEGVNIAHSGKTSATIYRYGDSMNCKLRIEEAWKIEELDFNICGLCSDSFLPPADVKIENENGELGMG